jgi:hypothetical protein
MTVMWVNAGSDERGRRLASYAGIVGDFRCSRDELNREHLVTVLAPKETDILHLPDAGDATGPTEATWGRGLEETVEASLVGGPCHYGLNDRA